MLVVWLKQQSQILKCHQQLTVITTHELMAYNMANQGTLHHINAP